MHLVQQVSECKTSIRRKYTKCLLVLKQGDSLRIGLHTDERQHSRDLTGKHHTGMYLEQKTARTR